jgi:hypothetical protein
MFEFSMFILLIIGLNLIQYLTKRRFPRIERIIKRILVISLIVLSIIVICDFNGYCLKGIYSLQVIGSSTLIFTILVFIFCQNTIKKFIDIFFLILIQFSFWFLFYNQTLGEFNLDENHIIIVKSPKMFTNGESLYITKTKYFIFNQVVFSDTDLGLSGIFKIDKIYNDALTSKILIFHDQKMDSWNPYEYTLNKKEWKK